MTVQSVRGVQRQEGKRYWAEDGTFDPPVQVVIDRFKRLRWGAYIHPRAGRKKHLYRFVSTIILLIIFTKASKLVAQLTVLK